MSSKLPGSSRALTNCSDKAWRRFFGAADIVGDLFVTSREMRWSYRTYVEWAKTTNTLTIAAVSVCGEQTRSREDRGSTRLHVHLSIYRDFCHYRYIAALPHQPLLAAMVKNVRHFQTGANR